MDRRNFFRAIIQGTIFSGLAGAGAYLTFRSPQNKGDVCDFDFVCQNCSKNGYCQIEDASRFRLKKRLKSENG